MPSSLSHFYLNTILEVRSKKVEWRGKSYWVAPVTLLVPGVLNGSRGPILYQPTDVAYSADAWNGLPVTANHPSLNGNFVSARSPEVMEKFTVGHIFNVSFSDRLRGEVWLSEEDMLKIDSRILSAIQNNQKVEVSTGLGLEIEDSKPNSVHNSPSGPVPYKGVARNYKPDHLAILIDSIGACSVSDGCGIFNSYSGGTMSESDKEESDKEDKGGKDTTKKCSCTDPTCDCEECNNKKNAKNESTPSKELDITPDKACQILKDGEVNGKPLTDAQKGMFGAKCGETKNISREIINDSDVNNSSSTKKEGSDTLSSSDYAYVPDPQKSSTWKLRIDDAAHVGAAIAAIGKGFRGQKVDIPSSDMPSVKKKLRTAWLKFHKDKTEKDLPDILRNESTSEKGEKKTMNREETINWLTSNCKCWQGEKGKEALNLLTDSELSSLREDREQSIANELALNETRNKKEIPITPPTPASVPTLQDILNAASPSDREAFQAAQQIAANEKLRLITLIVSNRTGDDRERRAKQLAELSINQLREMAQDIQTFIPQQTGNNQGYQIANPMGGYPAPVPSYLGANGVGNGVGQPQLEEKDVLSLPTINWREEAEKGK